jgi:hypothetical protein
MISVLIQKEGLFMENILTQQSFGKFKKFLLIIFSAVVVGTAWRIRGEHGWGSSWGLLTVGLMFSLLIYSVFGYRKKASVWYIAAAAISFMLTPPAWGTLLEQITGLVVETEKGGIPVSYNISPWSGIFFMVCLGFGMACLFAVMTARLFSDKQYKWYHFALLGAVYLIVEYAAKASVSHLIVAAVQPETCRVFSSALAEQGTTGALWKLYLQHFSSIGWAKNYAGGRNYFAEVEVVSRALGALALWIAVRFGLKDKICGRVSLSIMGIFAFAITVSDLFFYFGDGGLHRTQYDASQFIFTSCSWSMWEYFTGFIAGGLIMLILLCIPQKVLDRGAEIQDESFPKIQGKLRDIISFVVIFGLCFAATLIRPIALRFENSSILEIAAFASLSVIALIIGLLMVFGKIPAIWNAEPQIFSIKILPIFYLASVWIYFFVGIWEKNLSPTKYIVANFLTERTIIWWIMLASAVAFIAMYYALFGKYTKEKK